MRGKGPTGARRPDRIARDAHPPINNRRWRAVGQEVDPRPLQQSRACTAKRCAGLADHPRDAVRRLETGSSQKLLRSSKGREGRSGRRAGPPVRPQSGTAASFATGPRPLLGCRPLPSLSEGPRHPLGTTSGQTKSADPPSPPVAPAKNRTRAARRVPVRVRPGNPRTPSPRIARRWHRQVSGHQAPIDPRPARCFTSPEATPSHPHWKCHRARVSSESPAEEGVIIVVCRLDASPTASLRRSAVLSAKRPSVDGYLGHSPMPASRPSPC